MAYTERFSECHEVLDFIPADNRAANTYSTNWVQVSEFHRVVALLNVGPMAGGATLDALLEEATDALGTGAQNIAGKAITQLTQAGGDGNDLCIIELRTEELDENNGYDFVRLFVTVAAAAVDLSATLLGIEPRYEPVALTNVTEVVD